MLLLKVLRVKHYIKNFLVFIPLFFSGEILNDSKLMSVLFGFISFCLISSAVYILNDIRDVEQDRLHIKKRNRPIASGRVSIKKAMILAICCTSVAVYINCNYSNTTAIWIIIGYFCINVLYSLGLKNIPLIDVAILSSGFLMRVIYGAVISNIYLSDWLYLSIVTGSFFMGLGKRRNELIKIKQGVDTRKVLRYYTHSFLDKNMYVCVALTDAFYSMWAINHPSHNLVYTVPIFILMLMKYSLVIEGDSDGDPVDVITSDYSLFALGILYVFTLIVILYC